MIKPKRILQQVTEAISLKVARENMEKRDFHRSLHVLFIPRVIEATMTL